MGHPLCLSIGRQLGHRRLSWERPHARRITHHRRRMVHADLRPAGPAGSRHHAQVIDLPDGAIHVGRDSRHGHFPDLHRLRGMGGGHGAASVMAAESHPELNARLHARRLLFHSP